MQLKTQQKKFCLDLIKDQEDSVNLYKPGPYWSYKCKKSANWILKYGFDDFRGINNPIGTSYADNVRLDNRNEFGLGLKYNKKFLVLYYGKDLIIKSFSKI